jgi:NAD-reducing hydrogenase small subunit
MNTTSTPRKPRVATIWLDGCSGCHMSFLDLDERLIAIAQAVDVVVSPVVDPKTFPDDVDLTIIEGAISNEEDLHKAKIARARSKLVISLGDCAITGNVPAMRNSFEVDELFARAYEENATWPAPAQRPAHRPRHGVPLLLKTSRPVHEHIPVDLYVQGCPPPADAIFFVLSELVAGRIPDPTQLTRFGR